MGDWKEKVFDAVLGFAGSAGDIWANQQNIKQSNKQMAFQKMMSDTSAQRAVRDYTAAGLNPALAYERGASTPGGAAATLKSPIESGVANAQQARTIRAQLRALELQTNADVLLKGTQMALNNQNARTAASVEHLNTSELGIRVGLQPHQLRLMAANAMLAELGIPVARGEARYSESMGGLRPAMKDIFGSIGALRSAVDIFRRQ